MLICCFSKLIFVKFWLLVDWFWLILDVLFWGFLNIFKVFEKLIKLLEFFDKFFLFIWVYIVCFEYLYSLVNFEIDNFFML